jgi:DMSO reductase anchor subunit
MIETIVGGLILAVVSGLTFLAYKHNDGFRKILSVLAIPAVLLPLFYITFQFASIHTRIRLLGEKASEASGNTVEVFNSSIEKLNSDLTCAQWVLVISLVVWIYGAFLWFMPQILGLNKGENPQSKEDQKQ